MKILNLFLMGTMALFLSACATAPLTSTPTAPTTSTPATPATAPTTSTPTSPLATQAQKSEVLSWEAACQLYNTAKVAGVSAVVDGKIPATQFPLIRQLIAEGDPLCVAPPATTAEITQDTETLTVIALQLDGAIQK